MKKSLAPSSIFKKRKLSEDSVEIRLNGKSDVKINHLEIFTLKPVNQESSESKENEEENNGEVIKKNFVINGESSQEIAFAVSFKNNKRFAKTDLSGYGILIVGYSHCKLFNMEGKPIGNADLSRDPTSTDYPDYEEVGDKKQTVLLHKGSKKGTPVYIYPGNCVNIGSKSVWVCSYSSIYTSSFLLTLN